MSFPHCDGLVDGMDKVRWRRVNPRGICRVVAVMEVGLELTEAKWCHIVEVLTVGVCTHTLIVRSGGPVC